MAIKLSAQNGQTVAKIARNICILYWGQGIADRIVGLGLARTLHARRRPCASGRQMNSYEVWKGKLKESAGKFASSGMRGNPSSVKAKPIFERLAILHIKVIKYLLQNVSLLFPRHMSLPQILAASPPLSISQLYCPLYRHIYPHLHPRIRSTNIYEWNSGCSWWRDWQQAAGKMKANMKMNMKMKMRKIATKVSKGQANRNANTKAAEQDKLLHVNRIPRGLRGFW